jgi:hypothetical protein
MDFQKVSAFSWVDLDSVVQFTHLHPESGQLVAELKLNNGARVLVTIPYSATIMEKLMSKVDDEEKK